MRVVEHTHFKAFKVDSHTPLSKPQLACITNHKMILTAAFDKYMTGLLVEDNLISDIEDAWILPWEDATHEAHCHHTIKFKAFVPFNFKNTFEDYVNTVKSTYGVDYRHSWVITPSYKHTYAL
jgi:hypothetical protein